MTTIRHILGSCSPQSSYLGPSSCFLCPGLKAFGEIPRLYKLLSYVCSAVLQRMGPCPRSDGRWRSYSPRRESQDRWQSFTTEPPGKPSLLCKQLLSLLERPWLTAFSNRQPGRPCRLRSPVQAQASGCASGSSEEHSPTGGRWRAGHPGCRPHRSSGRNCLSQGPPSRSHVASG